MECGKLFCFGFDGLTAPDSILYAVDHSSVGAVILFSRNCQNATQIKSLCSKLREAGGDDLWILIDQEGGRVSRVKDPDIGPPAAGDLAKVDPEQTREAYLSMARELVALGIDFNLAPVADVCCNADNPVIADRAFGLTAEDVVPRVAAAVSGLTEAGMKSCAKHFPGLGDVSTDPHFTDAMSEASAASFRDMHFKPFIAARDEGVSAIMTTHLLASRLDPQRIATYSEDIVKIILREELGFGGIVITDDLEMKAISEGPPHAAWFAFEAGHDLMLICHDEEAQADALQNFSTQLSGNSAAKSLLYKALDRQQPFRVADASS